MELDQMFEFITRIFRRKDNQGIAVDATAAHSPGQQPEVTVATCPHPVSTPEKRDIKRQPAPAWLDAWPRRLLVIDCETTGIHSRDRPITFGAISLDRDNIQISDDGKSTNLQFGICHLIFDPGVKSHPEAEVIHGFDDWTVRHQQSFHEVSAEIIELMESADVIAGDNVKFDIEFLGRAFSDCGLVIPERLTICTMGEYRCRGFSKSARLDVALQHAGLSREGRKHGAAEDAWLALQLLFWLRTPIRPSPPTAAICEPPTNFRQPPERPAGPLPRRKARRRKTKEAGS